MNQGEAKDREDPLATDMVACMYGRDCVAAMMRCIDRLAIIGSQRLPAPGLIGCQQKMRSFSTFSQPPVMTPQGVLRGSQYSRRRLEWVRVTRAHVLSFHRMNT